MRNCARVHRHNKVNKMLRNNSYTPFCNSFSAINESDHKTPKINSIRLSDVCRTIAAVLKGEKDTKGQYTVGAFSFLLFCLFKLIGALGIAGTLFLGVLDFTVIFSLMKNECYDLKTFILLVIALFVLGVVFIYSVIVWGAANEIEKEKDKNFVLAVFSGVVSFASLIVSVILFIREVT